MQPQQPVSQRRRSLDAFSVIAFIATIVVAIFIVLPSPSLSSPATKAVFLAAGALITLAVYILARLTRGNIIIPSTALVGALWLPAIAYALSAAFSKVSFANALWGTALEPNTLGFMLVLAALGTLAALAVRRPEQYRSFFRASGITFGVLALVSVLTVLVGQFSPQTISPAFSFLGSFTDLAFVLGLGVILILLALRFLDISPKSRRGLVVSTVLALILLAIANASLVWILLALVALGLFVESIMRRTPKGSEHDLDEAVMLDEAPLESDEGNHSLVLPLVVLVAALFFLIGGTLGGALGGALHVSATNVRPSWQSTFAVAGKTYATAPFFGSGPSTFGAEWLKYRDVGLNSTVFWNTDFTSGIGVIPTSLVTTGIVGALAWVAFFLLFIVVGLRMLIRRTPEDAFVRYVAIASFLGTIYLFTIAFFDVPGAVVLALAFILAGIFVSTMRYSLGGRQWGVLFSKSPRLGFVIVFFLTILLLASVVAAYALIERAIATTELGSAMTSFSKGNLDAAERSAQQASSFAPSATAYQIQAGIAYARLNSIAASSTLTKAVAQKAYQQALSTGINAALTATNLNPSDYQSWLVLGNLYAQAVPLGITGSYDSAKSAYGKAEALNPTNPQIPYIIAQLDVANKNLKAAEADLKQAIALKQDYTDAIFMLSQLEIQDGNVKDALNSALAAAYFSPNDPNILFQVGILYAATNDLANASAALSAAVTANPQFANARYFLAAVLAKQGDTKDALTEMQTIAGLSSANATAVAPALAELAAGKNPFPANLFSASSTPVKQ